MGQLDGRVAVVTGSSRGIGRAIAEDLASRGAKVVINYNSSSDAAEAVVQQIKDNGGEAIAVQANVADFEQAQALIKAATEEFGQIDILVNNAGITRDNIIARLKEDDWDAVIGTNLKSAWNCCKHATRPMMRKRYGRIINITSVSGVAGQIGQSNYSASKAGMIGLTKSLAREVATRNITVNAVAPGFIETEMTSDLDEAVTEYVLTNTPMQRMGSVADVANAVAFFASEEANFVTGQVLLVDGGLVMG